MRTLFITLCKVFGLLQVYTGLAYCASVLPFIQMLDLSSSTDVSGLSIRTTYGSSIALTTASMAIMLVLTFGVAWVLLFRARWLADKLKVPEQEAQPPLSGDAILGAGARLLGLFFVVQAAPALICGLGQTISTLLQMMRIRDSMGGGAMGRFLTSSIWRSLVAPALKLGLGLLLALRTDKVLQWMNGKKDIEMNKDAVQGGRSVGSGQ